MTPTAPEDPDLGHDPEVGADPIDSDPIGADPIDSDPTDSDLDGHTTEELVDYLDRGRTPRDESIEGSAGCRMALAAMERLRLVSASLLEQETLATPEADESWIRGILDNISREAHAGRDIPVTSDFSTARLAITEGAVRGMLRSAGDSVDGVVIGRCRLHGDVRIAGQPITVQVDASVVWGTPILPAAQRIRSAMAGELQRHTELVIAGIDVVVHDIHGQPLDERDTA